MSQIRTVIFAESTTEPVSLSEAKNQLRLDTASHDALVSGLIKAARQKLENLTGQAFVSQTWDMFLDAFPGCAELELPFPPLQTVTGVYYTPDGSVEATFAASNYEVDVASQPGRIVLKSSVSWPSNTLKVANGVRVRFVCGYGAAAAVPQPLVQAIQMLVTQWYDSPPTYEVGPVMAVPFSVENLIADYRMYHVGVK
jgi:uncharacterized phiE125 gp8 family phage protein